MPVQLYNSLTKKKDSLPEPQEKKIIKMYSCGVTVYDNCHLGHARSLYIFDTFKRDFGWSDEFRCGAAVHAGGGDRQRE